MTIRPRILSISFSNFLADARVLRQLKILAEFGDVTTIGFGQPPEGATEHFELAESLHSLPQTLVGVALLATRRHQLAELRAPANRAALKILSDQHYDLIVANEARALPLAHAVAKGAPVWGDMHEWAPEERTNILSWRLLIAPFMRYICKKYLPMTDAVTTVNGSIARLYEEQFGIRAEIVRNTIPTQPLIASPLEPDRIRLVHSGAAIPGRSLETLIEATNIVDDRFSLDLYLVKARDGGKYWSQLRALAGSSSKVTLRDPVPPAQLPTTLNAYDVGVFVFRPLTTNHRYMLPNKFFDFVQARLAVIFSPSVETSALINAHGLGIVTHDTSVDALVTALNTLTSEKIATFKSNANIAAAVLNSTNDETVERDLVKRLLSHSKTLR